MQPFWRPFSGLFCCGLLSYVLGSLLGGLGLLSSLVEGLFFLSCRLWALYGRRLLGLLGLFGDLLDLRFLGDNSLEATRFTNSLDLGNLFVSD